MTTGGLLLCGSVSLCARLGRVGLGMGCKACVVILLMPALSFRHTEVGHGSTRGRLQSVFVPAIKTWWYSANVVPSDTGLEGERWLGSLP